MFSALRWWERVSAALPLLVLFLPTAQAADRLPGVWDFFGGGTAIRLRSTSWLVGAGGGLAAGFDLGKVGFESKFMGASQLWIPAGQSGAGGVFEWALRARLSPLEPLIIRLGPAFFLDWSPTGLGLGIGPDVAVDWIFPLGSTFFLGFGVEGFLPIEVSGPLQASYGFSVNLHLGFRSRRIFFIPSRRY